MWCWRFNAHVMCRTNSHVHRVDCVVISLLPRCPLHSSFPAPSDLSERNERWSAIEAMLGDFDEVESDFGPQRRENELIGTWLIIIMRVFLLQVSHSLTARVREREMKRNRNAFNCQASKSSKGVNLLRFNLTHPIPNLIIKERKMQIEKLSKMFRCVRISAHPQKDTIFFFSCQLGGKYLRAL